MTHRIRIASVIFLIGIILPLQALAQGGGVPSAQSGPQGAIQANPALFVVFSGAVDHAAAGCGLRNFDSCTIRLRGIPANSTVLRAFVYWAQICLGTSCPTSVNMEFQGRTITSSLIGTNPQPCWAGSLIGAYRADVTGLMPGTSTAALANKVINGDYSINAIPSHPSERDGRDPWTPGTTNLPKAAGATLVVVYSNPALSTVGRVYLHNGVHSLLGGTLDATLALVPAAPTSITNAKFTRFGADGQVGFSTTPNTAADDQTFFGGPRASCPAPTALTQIAGIGSAINADSDWNGDDGGPMNQLWDTHTTTVTSLLGGGATNYCARYIAPGDCVTFIGYVLTVR